MQQPDYTGDPNQFNGHNGNNQRGHKPRSRKVQKPKSITVPNKRSTYAISWNVELPLDHSCQIYPRVSSPEQMENVSVEMQKDKTFAISCGWKESLIILDDRDLGVSGQIRMEDRVAFNEMLRRIANNEIKAVVVVNVDRLFRNRWGDESGKFMEICYTYGVLVVTPDFIYDFRISWHIDRFRRRCEEAWNYLEYHVYGRMLAAKDERGFAGYWAGGNLPIGYILDLEEKLPNGKSNPNFFHYIPYEPHAEVVRWIFKRFKELNGSVRALMVEFEAKPCLFPHFDEDMPELFHKKLNQYIKTEDGYTITTISGLRRLLVNRAYIGYWVYKNEVVSTNNHDAIVDLNTFAYAYNRLSITQLDGTPNQRLVNFRKTYAKRHNAERPAILKECIRSDSPEVSIYVKDRKLKKGVVSLYSIHPKEVGGGRGNPTAMILASGLDALVLNRLREHLRRPEAEKDFQDFAKVEAKAIEEAKEEVKGIERGIKEKKTLIARTLEQIKSGKLTDPDLAQAANESYEVAKQELRRLEGRKKVIEQMIQGGETSETLKDINRDIEATKATMARTLEQIKSGKLTDPDLAQAANESYEVAKQELRRLEERKKATEQIAQEDNERRTYKALMRDVDEAWNEVVLPEEHPRLAHLFIKSVTLVMVAPSFFSMTIEWVDPAWDTESGLCYKGTCTNHKWSKEEVTILKEHYPTATNKELAELLPGRSRLAMYDYYKTKGLENPRQARGEKILQDKKGEMPYYVCLEDWRIMQQYDIPAKEMKAFGSVKLITWSC